MSKTDIRMNDFQKAMIYRDDLVTRTAMSLILTDTLDELAESPLPGARYAHAVVLRRFGFLFSGVDKAETS